MSLETIQSKALILNLPVLCKSLNKKIHSCRENIFAVLYMMLSLSKESLYFDSSTFVKVRLNFILVLVFK